MLKNDINNALSTAMKSKDEATTMALRNIKTRIIEAEKKDNSKEITDSDIMTILAKLVKERKQSIDMYTQAKRQDLVDAETFELSVIESYLPKQMSLEDLKEKVSALIKENNFSSIKDMGKTIKAFNEKYSGMADGRTLSEVIKASLS